MGITQIEKIQIGEQVYGQMRNQIMEGEWKPGEKIPSETQLIQLFGVSRGTIRQAIQKLAGEELIETRRGAGSFVRMSGIDSYFKTNTPLFNVGKHEMKQIFEFRRMFESSLAETAAQKINKLQLRKLKDNYEKLKERKDNVKEFVELDLAFHKIICISAENTLATQIFNSYEVLLKPAILRMVEVIGTENGIKYHRMLIDALTAGDSKMAYQIMSEHLDDNMNRFNAIKLD